MKIKKIIIAFLMAIILVLAAGICIFMTQKPNTNQKENSGEDMTYVEKTSEEEIKYADVSEAVVGNRTYLGDFEGELSWDVVDEQDGKSAANIGDYGNLNMAGHKVFDSYVVKGGVRPAMWVNK